MKTRALVSVLVLASQLTLLVPEIRAELLCKNKKSGAVLSRKACKRSEVALPSPEIRASSTATAAGALTGASVSLSDTGAVSGGSEVNTGLDVAVSRIGVTGGTVNTTGVTVNVVGDTGGDSTNVGLSVNTTGADTNFAALFQGGNVGIGVSDPDESLELAGRLHLGQTSAPASAADKLYNIGGSLFWGGQAVAVGTPSSGSGTITGVVAGSGLIGGGTSGTVALSVDAGTGPNNLVQLNSSGELPTVSGANLSALNASSITTGTLPDGRLSSNVSQLGGTIGLASEVTGTLPVANGGTGSTSLANLFALGTNTTGNYVASVGTTGGLSGGAAGSEGGALSLSIDQSFTPTWTGLHNFSAGLNVGTTTASTELLHLNGRVHIEQSSAPSITTDRLYNVGGELFFNGLNITDGALGGDILGVVAGTGLTGGATSGTATLNVDAGTTANKIVQLDSSGHLPAVNGSNLTSLNGTNISSGTVADARLSNLVTKLGTQINLDSEVTGVLPTANGGTGQNSLANLIALSTHTTGNYVASVTAGSGITLGGTAGEGSTFSIALNEGYSPFWTAGQTFSGVATEFTTVGNEDFVIDPAGTGQVGIGTTTPSAMIDIVQSSASATAGSLRGSRVSVTDTGVVNSGADNVVGSTIAVVRTGATGGTITSTGLDLSLTADTGGTSSATGLNVAVSGADVNYAALFTGGAVGIGTTAPTSQLDVDLQTALTAADSQVGSTVAVADTGNVTAGTDTTIGSEIIVSRTGATGASTIANRGLTISVTDDAGGSSTNTGLTVAVTGGDNNVAASFDGGSVGIGTTEGVLTDVDVDSGSLVVGDGAVCVDDNNDECANAARNAGTIYAEAGSVTGMDLAEKFPMRDGDPLSAGEIAMVDTTLAERCVRRGKDSEGNFICLETEQGYVPFVTRSSGVSGAAKRVLGVVSTEPGMTLGGFGDQALFMYRKAPIALAGRVPVKVSDQNGPIEVGDRITVSSTPGVGMRATGAELVVGIALEPLTSSEGTVLVLVK